MKILKTIFLKKIIKTNKIKVMGKGRSDFPIAIFSNNVVANFSLRYKSSRSGFRTAKFGSNPFLKRGGF